MGLSLCPQRLEAPTSCLPPAGTLSLWPTAPVSSITQPLSPTSIMLASVGLTRKQPPEFNSMSLHSHLDQLRAESCVMTGDEGGKLGLSESRRGEKKEDHIDSQVTAISLLLPTRGGGD